MKLHFLGSGSSFPTVHRGVSSIALQFESGDVWLLDCGEGTQIQLQKVNVSRRKISKIFITHLHGDHLFGLPGFLCTLSSQIGSNNNVLENSVVDLPVIDVYGPLGLRKFLYMSLSLSRSPLLIKYKVHELQPVESQYPEDWGEWIVNHDPPSSLHPSEEPGQIIQPTVIEDKQFSWNLVEDKTISVKAAMIHHRIPSFAFVIKEKERVGPLLVDKLKTLGIKPGPIYGQLKQGLSVTLDDGTVINPSDVLGPSTAGRCVVICGDTSDSSPVHKVVSKYDGGVDVLVHEATHEDALAEKALEFGHSTPSMAAECCKELGAKTLLLNHFSQRYKDTSHLLKEAEEALKGTNTQVFCAEDLFVFNVARTKT